MLKIMSPLMTLPLLLTTPNLNYWPLCISALLLLFTLSMTILPAQLMIPSIMSDFTTMDQLSTPMISLSIWITSLMLLASYKELLNKNNPKTFLMYVLLLLATLTLAFSAKNMMMFYVFFEAALIPTILLILGWGYQPERLQASTYLLLYTLTASLPLLASLMIMYTSPINLTITQINWSLNLKMSPLTSIWWLITILAFLAKMPLYTLHLWLPKAHVEAPIAGSMILAAVLLKLGSYGLMRLSSMLVTMNTLINPPMMSLSLWGAVLTSAICLRQPDMKSLIAYSSVGHMSLLVAGLMSNSTWGWNASLTMMLAHGMSSSSLFALANMSYETTSTRSIYLSKGIITIFPTMSMWWFLACAMNMSAPPTPNLLSELFLTMSIISYSTWSILILPPLIFLSAAYSLYLYTAPHHGPIPYFSNPTNMSPQRNQTTMMFHLLPATMMILKPDTIMVWV